MARPHTTRRRRSRPTLAPRGRRRLAAGLALLLPMAIAAEADAGPIADWFRRDKVDYSSGPPKPTGDQTSSLMGRWLTREVTPHFSQIRGSSMKVGQAAWESTRVATSPEVEAELDAAMKLYDAKKYAEALPRLSRIAASEGKKGTSPACQKALFHAAECQYQLRKYVDSNNSFEKLIRDNTGLESKYLEKATARQYEIAQMWLAAEDPTRKPLPLSARFNGQMPLADSDGHAVKILEQVRLHDIKGPLSDVAVLRLADHYHAVGDYESAALYYDQLVADHSKSPYRERAMRSSIDAKMKGYMGPRYDKTGLESARDMVKQTMASYPENQEGAKDLYHSLDLINDEEAASDYEAGLYYVQAMKPTSAEYQFGRVIARHPKSKWADKARAEMAKLAKVPRKASLPSKIMTLPGATDSPVGGGGGGSGVGSGMGGASSAGGLGGSPY